MPQTSTSYQPQLAQEDADIAQRETAMHKREKTLTGPKRTIGVSSW